MNGEAGNENGQVKIDASQAGETEGDAKQFELIHVELCGYQGRSHALSVGDASFHLTRSQAHACATLHAMLDIRLIREQPDFVKSRLATRGGDDQLRIDEVLAVDAERRKLETALQQCNADRK